MPGEEDLSAIDPIEVRLHGPLRFTPARSLICFTVHFGLLDG